MEPKLCLDCGERLAAPGFQTCRVCTPEYKETVRVSLDRLLDAISESVRENGRAGASPTYDHATDFRVPTKREQAYGDDQSALLSFVPEDDDEVENYGGCACGGMFELVADDHYRCSKCAATFDRSL